jgi:hypothetical protein
MQSQRPGVSLNPSGRPPVTADMRTAMDAMKEDSPTNVRWMIAARDCRWGLL